MSVELFKVVSPEGAAKLDDWLSKPVGAKDASEVADLVEQVITLVNLDGALSLSQTMTDLLREYVSDIDTQMDEFMNTTDAATLEVFSKEIGQVGRILYGGGFEPQVLAQDFIHLQRAPLSSMDGVGVAVALLILCGDYVEEILGSLNKTVSFDNVDAFRSAAVATFRVRCAAQGNVRSLDALCLAHFADHLMQDGLSLDDVAHLVAKTSIALSAITGCRALNAEVVQAGIAWAVVQNKQGFKGLGQSISDEDQAALEAEISTAHLYMAPHEHAFSLMLTASLRFLHKSIPPTTDEVITLGALAVRSLSGGSELAFRRIDFMLKDRIALIVLSAALVDTAVQENTKLGLSNTVSRAVVWFNLMNQINRMTGIENTPSLDIDLSQQQATVGQQIPAALGMLADLGFTGLFVASLGLVFTGFGFGSDDGFTDVMAVCLPILASLVVTLGAFWRVRRQLIGRGLTRLGLIVVTGGTLALTAGNALFRAVPAARAAVARGIFSESLADQVAQRQLQILARTQPSFNDDYPIAAFDADAARAASIVLDATEEGFWPWFMEPRFLPPLTAAIVGSFVGFAILRSLWNQFNYTTVFRRRPSGDVGADVMESAVTDDLSRSFRLLQIAPTPFFSVFVLWVALGSVTITAQITSQSAALYSANTDGYSVSLSANMSSTCSMDTGPALSTCMADDAAASSSSK